MFDAFIPNASVVSTIFRSFQSVLFYLSTFHSIRVTCGPKCLLSFNPCYMRSEMSTFIQSVLHSSLFRFCPGAQGHRILCFESQVRTDTMDFQLSPSTVGRSQGSRSLHPPYSSFLKFCPWHPNVLHFNIFSLSVRQTCSILTSSASPSVDFHHARSQDSRSVLSRATLLHV
ncbi:hypothetical protein C8R48DRAFT_782328 [Suillus tomentosus]|nr:hypothetical protein C8R48DRAFT_782328 [Suillus tomentosus]